ncbi:MAG: tetratricopeptide repeat protein [Caldilineaceae bacterium]|nr:tetratricopeptide repeat protein [Caldilineaceae bacterium]
MSKPKKSDNKPGGHRRAGKPNSGNEEKAGPPQPMSRLDLEKQMAELGKLLNEQDFQSLDDVNDFLSGLMAEEDGIMPTRNPETPLEKAQEIIWEAMETENPLKAIRLAQKALKTSADCVDAYLLLADLQAESLEEAYELTQQAVAAGERALGAEMFEENRGHFWLIVETRPYMRARLQLGQMLWQLGRPSEAIEQYRELLELNPNDNQGVRYGLLISLMQMCRDEEAAELIAQFDDDAFAVWNYNRALLTFRQHGRGPEADAALNAALDVNEYVPDYLLGYADMPFDDDMPDMHGWGDEAEAILYTAQAMVIWLQTPGAQMWLAERYDALD